MYHWEEESQRKEGLCTGNLDMHLDFDVAVEIKSPCLDSLFKRYK